MLSIPSTVDRKWGHAVPFFQDWARELREGGTAVSWADLPGIIHPASPHYEPRMVGMHGLDANRYPIAEKVRMFDVLDQFRWKFEYPAPPTATAVNLSLPNPMTSK